MIKRNTSNLLNLVNQILDLRKLETGTLQLSLVQDDIIFYLRYLLESFHSLAEREEKSSLQPLTGQDSPSSVQDPASIDLPVPPPAPTEPASRQEEEPSLPTNSPSSTLLIIEDNPDVVEYLESLLGEQYQLEIARDGQEGIETALEQIPDLIISDVMMPKKNGLEVCETLKADERTSHIPIVLLTAKADVDSKIAGLKRGADAYLSKPFNQEELFIRLEKLHQLRQQLQARYTTLSATRQSPGEGEPTSTPTTIEDAFISKLRSIIEANLDDEKFGIPELCKAIGISRTQLHLKIKALTNRSTSHYIRAIRLHKAKELLQRGELNIIQVAYEVGFYDRAYFSRAFSQEFGASPKEFLKN